VFLLDKNDNIYSKLKKHSLCTNGYISQVIKVKSLIKNAMSVCSKILLQINAKLGGANYKVKIDKTIDDKKLMVIGVYSSHIRGKRTCVAMVATIDNNFIDFYNSEEIIEEENKEQLQFKVSTFIEKAINAFEKLNKDNKPKNIIIYRQGVSLQQKKYLGNEIKNIDEVCKQNNILYYYILVNTKVNYKFFAKENNQYYNPNPGLLVIDGVTHRNFFEFYIQPQLVTGGSATPTCFHVAYGNMNLPEFLPKFTYDLCHLYSNWQGPVRIPNVIKAAEKLEKMTAKYTFDELNDNLKFGQSYL
jgi:aubergine-like protein